MWEAPNWPPKRIYYLSDVLAWKRLIPTSHWGSQVLPRMISGKTLPSFPVLVYFRALQPPSVKGHPVTISCFVGILSLPRLVSCMLCVLASVIPARSQSKVFLIESHARCWTHFVLLAKVSGAAKHCDETKLEKWLKRWNIPPAPKMGLMSRFSLFYLESPVSINYFSPDWCHYDDHAYTHDVKTFEFVQYDFSQFHDTVQG